LKDLQDYFLNLGPVFNFLSFDLFAALAGLLEILLNVSNPWNLLVLGDDSVHQNNENLDD